jgi:hypothetical protein
MFVFACPIIARSQCWLFALAAKTSLKEFVTSNQKSVAIGNIAKDLVFLHCDNNVSRKSIVLFVCTLHIFVSIAFTYVYIYIYICQYSNLIGNFPKMEYTFLIFKFHQYQQNERASNHSAQKGHDIWCWKKTHENMALKSRS